MKRAHVVDGHRRERRFAADRRVAVRMRAVEQLEERAVGDRAGHVAQLRQPVQAQLAHAREVVVAQRRTRRRRRTAGRARDRAKRLRTVTLATVASEPMSVSNCAPRRASASCISIAERSPLPSSSMSAVTAARPSLPAGSDDGAAADEQREGDQRHLRVVHRPHAHAVGQRRFLDGRERKRRASGRNRQLRRDRPSRRGVGVLTTTAAVVESGAASDGAAVRHDAERDAPRGIEIARDDRLQRRAR